jgi:hypothetical protein
VEEKTAKVIDKGRKFIEIVRNHPESSINLDMSEASLSLVQEFLTSLEEGKATLEPSYVSLAMVAMAVYLGDYIKGSSDRSYFECSFSASGAMSEITLFSNLKDGGKHETYLLYIVREAMKNPNSDDVSVKIPLIKTLIEGLL